MGERVLKPNEVDTSRVCEVVCELPNGKVERGSGLLLPGEVVLTAWHVVAKAALVRAVFLAGMKGRWSARVTSMVRLGSDLAVLRLDHCDRVVGSLPVGGFGDRGVVLAAETVGFPRWKIREVDAAVSAVADHIKKYRASAHLRAQLMSGSNTREGAVELEVEAPEPDPHHPHVSAWEGMSGAPVWCGGKLVGVVTDHHRPEGLGRLSAVRLDVCLRTLSPDQSAEVLPLLGLESLADIQPAWQPPGSLEWAAYRDIVRDIAPRDLRERENELLELARFCASSESFVYWQAPAKAGKTALMAAFALDPPDGVTVVPFFVTARWAGQSDSTSFVDVMLDQLSALAGEPVPALATPLVRHAHARRLLADIAAREHASGGQLVLLVDGLDEDTGQGNASGKPSIASLLPIHHLPGLKVIVAGRPDPPLPPDVQATPDHPLHRCPRPALAPSPHAQALMQAAEQELDQLLAGSTLAAAVIEQVAASGGGLTLTDLAELTGHPVHRMRRLLHGHAGRTIVCRAGPFGEHGYIFAHETLKATSEQLLGSSHLVACRELIHIWADRYRTERWPAHTPRYLLTGYQRILETTGDVNRLAALAADARRHDRMLDLIGGDSVAYEEIQTALRFLSDAWLPDLRMIVRIARRRERLQQRNDNVPPNLPAVWARLGHIPRAEALARSLTDSSAQMLALAAVAGAVGGSDPSRAEQIARTITDPGFQARALTEVAIAVAGSNPDHAERIARTITDPFAQMATLVDVTKALAGSDPSRAEQLARTITDPGFQARALTEVAIAMADDNPRRAIRLARSFTHSGARAQVLAKVATVVATFDSDRAVKLVWSLNNPDARAWGLVEVAKVVAVRDAERAIRLTHSLIEPFARAQTLAEIVKVVAATDPNHAQQIACAIADPYGQARALAEVAKEVIGSDPGRALQFARAITRPDVRTQALAEMAELLVDCHPSRAAQISAEAEMAARSIDNASKEAQQLASVARAVVGSDPDRAEQVVRTILDPNIRAQTLAYMAKKVAERDPNRAEQIARAVANPHDRAWALSEVAKVVAAADAGHAEEIARTISDPHGQAQTMVHVAIAVAGNDPDRAEQIARNIENPYDQAWALTEVGNVVADTDLGRVARIAGDAERVARTISEPYAQTRTLAYVARVVAGFDTGRAMRIAGDAEQVARTITDPHAQTQALIEVAKVMAVADAEHAEQIVRIMTRPVNQAWALTEVMKVLARIDSTRAARIAVHAEEVAQSIERRFDRTLALIEIATTLMSIDRRNAERIVAEAEKVARSITGPDALARALTDISKTLAGIDPDRAEQTASTIASPEARASALAEVAKVLAAIDPARSEHIARTIADPDFRARALAEIAKVLVNSDPDRAERIARTVTDSDTQRKALIEAGIAIAETTPELTRASRIAAAVIVAGGSWSRILESMQPPIQLGICDDLLAEPD